MAFNSPVSAAALLAAAVWPGLAEALEPQPPELVSVRWDTGEATSGLCTSSIRFGDNPRFLSFACYGDDLTPGDTNDRRDTVLLDRATGEVELISIDSNGQQVGYDSQGGVPSPDGSQVAFGSFGALHPDYFPPPTLDIGRVAIYLRHRDIGQTDLISRDAFGQALTGTPVFYGANFSTSEILFHYSGDIRVGPNQSFGVPSQLWVRSWKSGAVELLSGTPGGALSAGGGFSAHLSATGRYALFVNTGDDLGPPARIGDPNIYLRDRETGDIERLTWPYTGGEFQNDMVALTMRDPRISSDGRFVVFSTNNPEIHPNAEAAGGLQVYLLDRQSGEAEHLSVTPGYRSYNVQPNISDNGRYVAWFSRNFAADGPPDPPADMRAIWVLDRDSGERFNVTEPLGPLHQDGEPIVTLAADGSAIAFTWRIADPTNPLFGPALVYTVDLFGEPPPPPPAPPMPVPAASPWWLLMLAGGVVLIGGRFVRRRPV